MPMSGKCTICEYRGEYGDGSWECNSCSEAIPQAKESKFSPDEDLVEEILRVYTIGELVEIKKRM